MISLKQALEFTGQYNLKTGEQTFILFLICEMGQGRYEYSAEEISKATGNSMRSVQRHMTSLKSKGIITIKNYKAKCGRVIKNGYRLNDWQMD